MWKPLNDLLVHKPVEVAGDRLSRFTALAIDRQSARPRVYLTVSEPDGSTATVELRAPDARRLGVALIEAGALVSGDLP